MISGLLYLTFQEISHESYTATDRYFLKELLANIESIVQKVLMAGKANEIGFYLTVYELESCKDGHVAHRLDEMYDLREIPGIASCEEI
jgi:hypothetical protein